MPPYDDDYWRQLEYEWELDRQEYERQRRLEDDERHRELEWELEQARQLQLGAPASAGSPGRTKGTLTGAHSWNGRWARRTREEACRRVREDDENRWAEQRRAARDNRRQRSFIYPIFVGTLLLLLGFIAFRAFGSYPVTSMTVDPLTGQGYGGQRLSQTVTRSRP